MFSETPCMLKRRFIVLSKFSLEYGFQQAKLIRKLTIRIGWVCWYRKIVEKLAQKVPLSYLCTCCCRKSCPHLGSWLNANLNGQFVIAIWRITFHKHGSTHVLPSPLCRGRTNTRPTSSHRTSYTKNHSIPSNMAVYPGLCSRCCLSENTN